MRNGEVVQQKNTGPGSAMLPSFCQRKQAGVTGLISRSEHYRNQRSRCNSGSRLFDPAPEEK